MNVLSLKPGFEIPTDKILLRAPRKDNMYMLDMSSDVPLSNVSCFLSKAYVDESALWHRRLYHVNYKNMNKLSRFDLVKGFPNKEFTFADKCSACL